MILTNIIQTIGAVAALQTTPVALPMVCNVKQTPVITITPKTRAIQYDKTKSSAELTAFKSGTISPYGLNVDQTTGGLRHDQPLIQMNTKFDIITDPNTQTVCLSYHAVNVEIKLQPKIYIAKEFSTGQCGRMVIGHEKKHVTTDRYVINKYAKKMGLAIQKSVNETGAIGPFPASRTGELQDMMAQHIENAMSSIKLAMTNEMNIRQQHVDSLEEYERVSAYCEENSKRAFENLQQGKKR